MNRAKRAFSAHEDRAQAVRALKALGQNFLIDKSIASDIAALANITPADRIWEIGPGTGILTRELLTTGACLTAFELDTRLEDGLRSEFGPALDLRMQDILQANWPQLIEEQKQQIKLVANIPYHITSPLLALLESHHRHFSVIVLMLQKEVAERVCASAGSKAYGLLSIRMQLIFDTSLCLQVGREKFDPVPNVDSAVIKLISRRETPQINDPDRFHRIIRAAFSHRRKTLRNNLLCLFSREQLDAMQTRSGIDLNRRGETLSEAEYITLCDSF